MNPPSGNPAQLDPQARMPVEAPQRKQLTAEEIEVLKECGRESFWYRCVPLGVAGAIATKLLIQKGILKPNPYYGSFPKMSAAVLVAYFAGKISYQGACNEKFLKLQNSPIADMLRQKYGIKRDGFGTESGGWNFSASSQYGTQSPREQKLSEYYDTSSVLDTDSTREVHELDDTYRPSIDNVVVQRKVEPSKEYVSYDDLRRRNREAYEKSLAQAPPHPPGRPAPIRPPPPVSSDAFSPSLASPEPIVRPPSGPRKNKYGDIIDE